MGGKIDAATPSEMPGRRISSQSLSIASSERPESLPSGRMKIEAPTGVREELAAQVERASAGMSNIIACHIHKPVSANASASQNESCDRNIAAIRPPIPKNEHAGFDAEDCLHLAKSHDKGALRHGHSIDQLRILGAVMARQLQEMTVGIWLPTARQKVRAAVAA